jgi:hypothetical protein
MVDGFHCCKIPDLLNYKSKNNLLVVLCSCYSFIGITLFVLRLSAAIKSITWFSMNVSMLEISNAGSFAITAFIHLAAPVL